MNWVIFLVPLTIGKLGQKAIPSPTATENWSKRAKHQETVTALLWRKSITIYNKEYIEFQHLVWLYDRYGADHYQNRVNYLSNPDVTFMGERAGSLDENNARVLRETRFRSASVGDESATIGMYRWFDLLILIFLISPVPVNGGWGEWSDWFCPAECGSAKVMTR